MTTPTHDIRIPPALLDAARRATGRHNAKVPELVREGLAKLAGVNLADYPMAKVGRPRRQPAGGEAA